MMDNDAEHMAARMRLARTVGNLTGTLELIKLRAVCGPWPKEITHWLIPLIDAAVLDANRSVGIPEKREGP